jgi:2-keto-4-pentenoate hydratase
MIKQGLLGGLKGWKVGAATPAAQEKLGIAEPFRGPIFANYVKESGAKVPWSQVGCVLSAVEVEFCFVMASSLPPRDTPYTEDEVWGAVGHVTTAIEMAAQRSTAIAPLSKETLGPAVADCAVNGLVVLGGAVPLAAVDRAALPQLPATLAVTPAGGAAARAAGAGDNVLPFGPKAPPAPARPAPRAPRTHRPPRARGHSAAARQGSGVLVGPLASLTWLANHLAETLAGLRAGELVISGAAGRRAARPRRPARGARERERSSDRESERASRPAPSLPPHSSAPPVPQGSSRSRTATSAWPAPSRPPPASRRGLRPPACCAAACDEAR